MVHSNVSFPQVMYQLCLEAKIVEMKLLKEYSFFKLSITAKISLVEINTKFQSKLCIFFTLMASTSLLNSKTIEKLHFEQFY